MDRPQRFDWNKLIIGGFRVGVSQQLVTFPRILRWRDDKKPEEADTLEGIRAFARA